MHWLTMYCSKLTGVSKNSGDYKYTGGHPSLFYIVQSSSKNVTLVCLLMMLRSKPQLKPFLILKDYKLTSLVCHKLNFRIVHEYQSAVCNCVVNICYAL